VPLDHLASHDQVAYCHTYSSKVGEGKDRQELTQCQLPAAKQSKDAADYLT